MLNKIKNFGRGKLTFTIAWITIAWSVVGFLLGQLDAETAGKLILAGLGTIGLRRAM